MCDRLLHHNIIVWHIYTCRSFSSICVHSSVVCTIFLFLLPSPPPPPPLSLCLLLSLSLPPPPTSLSLSLYLLSLRLSPLPPGSSLRGGNQSVSLQRCHSPTHSTIDRLHEAIHAQQPQLNQTRDFCCRGNRHHWHCYHGNELFTYANCVAI